MTGAPIDPPPTLAVPDTAPPEAHRISVAGQFRLSCYWFAYNFQWVALLAIVLPSQVALLAGEGRKELAVGAVTAIGALFSLILTPLAGAISDRSRARSGR